MIIISEYRRGSFKLDTYQRCAFAVYHDATVRLIITLRHDNSGRLNARS